MPAAIDPVIKKQVVNQWLSGDSRDRIAADNGIGAGTVSNIIDEWKKRVQDSDYESIRELSPTLYSPFPMTILFGNALEFIFEHIFMMGPNKSSLCEVADLAIVFSFFCCRS